MRYVIMNSDGEVYNEADDMFYYDDFDAATIYEASHHAAAVKNELKDNGYTDARVYPAVIIGK